MKITKWILTFLVFNIVYALTCWLCELYLGWIINLEGWEKVAYLLYLPITYMLASATVTLSSVVSPNRYLAPVYIRWFCVFFLILGGIFAVIVKFNLSLMQVNNLVYSTCVIFVSSPQKVSEFLKDSGV